MLHYSYRTATIKLHLGDSEIMVTNRRRYVCLKKLYDWRCYIFVNSITVHLGTLRFLKYLVFPCNILGLDVRDRSTWTAMLIPRNKWPQEIRITMHPQGKASFSVNIQHRKSNHKWLRSSASIYSWMSMKITHILFSFSANSELSFGNVCSTSLWGNNEDHT